MQKDNSHSGVWNDEKLSELAKIWGSAKIKAWSPDVTWHESYKPNLNPVDGIKPITDEDIAHAEASIKENILPSAKQIIEVICPDCGKKFFIKI